MKVVSPREFASDYVEHLVSLILPCAKTIRCEDTRAGCIYIIVKIGGGGNENMTYVHEKWDVQCDREMQEWE